MIRKVAMVSVLSAAWMLVAGHAQAHIKLLKPATWIQEGPLGDPQKTGPCGTAAGEGTETKAVTTYTAGEEITVEWTETVNHEGHFRIALAKDRSELQDPVITGICESAAISNPPQYPVLADGLFPVTTNDGQTMFSQKVKLPAGMTCDNCTLQVMQFMTPHKTPCLYYHCANIKIVAAGAAGSGGTSAAPIAPSGGSGGARPIGGSGAVAGSGASTGSGGVGASGRGAAGAAAGGGAEAGRTGGAGSGSASAGQVAVAGTGTSGAAGASSSSSGCAVASPGREHDRTLAWLFVLGLVLARKRRHA